MRGRFLSFGFVMEETVVTNFFHAYREANANRPEGNLGARFSLFLSPTYVFVVLILVLVWDGACVLKCGA